MTIKGQQRSYKLQNYDISINQLSQKQLSIQIIDSVLKIEFAEQELTLQKIAVSTLIMALEGLRKEISIVPTYKKQQELELLQLTVRIQSPFLKTIEENIFIKKFRDVEELEIVEGKMKSISQKLRTIKENGIDQNATYYSYQLEEKSHSGASFEPLAGIKLKKGKYLITFSFQLKATNQWLYLYLGQQNIISNSGFYTPTTNQFQPFTIRIIKSVTEDEKELQFSTNAASSYPVILRNKIITAQRLTN